MQEHDFTAEGTTSPQNADRFHGNVVLSEIKGLANTVDARFDGMEREQKTMREWMSRLSDAVDRVANVTGKFIGVEIRIAQSENDLSDLKLETAAVKEEVNKIQRERTRSGVITHLIAAFLGSIISGGSLAFIAHLFHL